MAKARAIAALSAGIMLFSCVALSGCEPRRPAAEGKRAIYLYLCGSNLETKQGAATRNLAEILRAAQDENTAVVIQTGGAKQWREYGIPADALTRYEVKDGTLSEIQRLPAASMGAKRTLSEFVGYCLETYPAERSALILWDHGGGSLGEICYDEAFGMDPLTPSEWSEALAEQDAHFDLIGFDACLTATNEMAARAARFADYMLASEEIEPTGGWDYGALVEAFSADGAMEEVAHTVAEAYLKKCERAGCGESATLSLFDLSRYGAFASAFDAFAQGLSEASAAQYGNFNIVRASSRACKFGANSRDEGASNLLDLYGFAEPLEASNPGASALLRAIRELVPYRIGGAGRENLGGVSLYFPLWHRSSELEAYLALCSSEPYRRYLSEIYQNVVGDTIAFSDRGSVAADGSFRICLTPESRTYLKSVEFSVLSLSEADGRVELIQLGIDNDLQSDWETLTFRSNFRGVWLALDGKLLNSSVLEASEESILFSAPVLANGRRSNLRFRFFGDEGGGTYRIIGLWDGLDENHLADKQITPLKEGDVITLLRKSVDPAQDRTIEEAELSEGETVVIGADGGTIAELPLKDRFYRYVFLVTDLFGNRYYSDTATLKMLYSYDELWDHPLPDGRYAAEITDIEWDSYWGAVG